MDSAPVQEPGVRNPPAPKADPQVHLRTDLLTEIRDRKTTNQNGPYIILSQHSWDTAS